MKTDTMQEGLVGPVHTVRTERAWIDRRDGRFVEHRSIESQAIFDLSGNRIEVIHYRDNSSPHSRSVVIYDAAGRLLEEQHFKGDGSPAFKRIYTYDDHGRLITDVSQKADGSFLGKGSSTYTTEGERHSVWQEISKPSDIYVSETVDDDGVTGTVTDSPAFISASSSKPETELHLLREIYDAKGKKLAHFLYKANGDLLSRDVYSYDAQGNRVRVSRYRSDFKDNGIPSWEGVYAYDSDGRMIEEANYYDGSLDARKLYTYDAKGRMTGMEQYEADGSLRGKMSNAYEFDPAGNWIKKTTSWWRAESGEFEPVWATYRTITYYGDPLLSASNASRL